MAAVLIVNFVQPAAAIHGIVGCDGQSTLEPIYLLIHQVVVLIFSVGGLLAAAALVYAGVMMIWGSEDAKRIAIQRVQRVLTGIGLVWTGPFIIAFLLIPVNVCTGGV
ncbi:hypothetical protein NGM07_09560 [Halorussus vallis]|nr:hypothetical protein [Halorussus vallis]USZ77564.1 hypothetical protein NGM07_09560 [Halorussus vallis]